MYAFVVWFLVYELWLDLYSTFVEHSGLTMNSERKLCLGGLSPKPCVIVGGKSLFFGFPGPQARKTCILDPPSQLVLGYHWLELLNQVQLNIFWNDKKFSFFLVHWYDLNSTISQKLKIAKMGKLIFHSFRTLTVILNRKIKTAVFEGVGGGSAYI